MSDLVPTEALWMDLWVPRQASVVAQCSAVSLPRPGGSVG